MISATGDCCVETRICRSTLSTGNAPLEQRNPRRSSTFRSTLGRPLWSLFLGADRRLSGTLEPTLNCDNSGGCRQVAFCPGTCRATFRRDAAKVSLLLPGTGTLARRQRAQVPRPSFKYGIHQKSGIQACQRCLTNLADPVTSESPQLSRGGFLAAWASVHPVGGRLPLSSIFPKLGDWLSRAPRPATKKEQG
jgi:hypothetical protein